MVRAEKGMQNAAVACASDDKFGKTFDAMMRHEDGAEEPSPIQKYCSKKYLVDNNLIDTNVYKFELNPDHLDVVEVDCGQFVKEALKIYRKKLAEKLRGLGLNNVQVDCALKKFQNLKYYNKGLVFKVLSDLNITEAQKARERKNFIALMKELFYIVGDCENV